MRLRRKIEKNPDKPEPVKTVRNVGYVFRARRRTLTMDEPRGSPRSAHRWFDASAATLDARLGAVLLDHITRASR
jgi:DNA-binding winged helix-turn-helix (wHTH) protein